MSEERTMESMAPVLPVEINYRPSEQEEAVALAVGMGHSRLRVCYELGVSYQAMNCRLAENEGFRLWFTAYVAAVKRERLDRVRDFICGEGSDALRQIVLDPEQSTADRVKAFRALAELIPETKQPASPIQVVQQQHMANGNDLGGFTTERLLAERAARLAGGPGDSR